MLARLLSFRKSSTPNGTSLAAYLGSVASLSLSLVAHSIGLIILARALGVQQFGIITLITSVSSLGLVGCGLGAGEALRRLTARNKAAYPAIFGHAVVLLLATGGVSSLVFAVVIAAWVPIGVSFADSFIPALLFSTSNILLFGWVGLAEQALLAKDDRLRANWVNMCTGIGRVAAVVVGCLFFGVSDARTYAVWHFGFNAAASLLALALVWNHGRPVLGIVRQEIPRGFSISMTAAFVVVRQNVDVLLVGMIAPASVVGVYGIARRLTATAQVSTAALDRLIISDLARAGRFGLAPTYQLAKHYAGYCIALALSASLALHLAAPLIVWVFGPQYQSAIGMTQILAWTLVFTSLQWTASDALNAAEYHRYRLIGEVCTGAVAMLALGGLGFLAGVNGILAASYAGGIGGVIIMWSILHVLARRSEDLQVVNQP